MEMQEKIELQGDIDGISLPKNGDDKKHIKLTVTLVNTQKNRHLASEIEAGAVKIIGYKADDQSDFEDGTTSEDDDPGQGELTEEEEPYEEE